MESGMAAGKAALVMIMAVLLLIATVESASATRWSCVDGARKLLQDCLPQNAVCPLMGGTDVCCNGGCAPASNLDWPLGACP